MERVGVAWIVGLAVLLLSGPTGLAAAIAYESTGMWWTRQTKAIENGAPALGSALPVWSGDQMVGLLTIACTKDGRGSYFEIPFKVFPQPGYDGKQLQMLLTINSKTFAAYVDRDRLLVYFNSPTLPPIPKLPAMVPGKSVPDALLEGKGVIQVRTDSAAAESGIIVRPTRAENASPATAQMMQRIRSQGLQPLALQDTIKACQAYLR